MSPNRQIISSWLKDPKNVADAQAAGFNVQRYMQNADPYEEYLSKMINANKGNPKFQSALYSQYLDYINPANKQAREQEDMANKYKIASDLASSDNAEAQAAGMKILKEIYPDYFGVSGDTGAGDTAMDNYYRAKQKMYKTQLEELGNQENVDPTEVALKSLLSGGNMDVIKAYEQPVTWEERMNVLRNKGNLLDMFSSGDIKYNRLKSLGY